MNRNIKGMMKVSIVTVVYNAVNTIERTIKSVLGQDYLGVEYIIVDGGSTDGTKDVLNRYSKMITHVISEPDEGIYDAMNKGIRLASGDVIAFLNSGDLYEQDTCTRVKNYFEQSDADILVGIAKMTEEGNFVGFRDNQPENIEVSMPCCHQAVFIKRQLFNSIGMYDTYYKICADFDWLLRAFFSKAKFIWTKEVYSVYDGEGISARMEMTRINEAREVALKYARLYHKEDNVERIEDIYKQRIDTFTLKNRYTEMFKKNAEYVRRMLNNSDCYIWGAGNDGRRCFKLLKSSGVEIVGFIDSYRKYEELYGVPIYLPNEVANNNSICIASSKYGKEIHNQALGLGFPENKIVNFTQLQSVILDLERENGSKNNLMNAINLPI